MSFETWLALAATIAVVALLPGPSSLLIAVQARALGLGAALAALAGDLVACALMVALVGAGLGQVLATYPALLHAIRLAGFAWLGWILWQALARRRSVNPQVRRASAIALCAQGFLTCAANPKLILHLTAFLPLFLDPAKTLAPQLAVIAMTQVAIDGLILGGWALLAVSTRHSWEGSRMSTTLSKCRRNRA